jgi:predicted peptidase
LDLVKKHGPPKLAHQGKKLPFIVVSPQCPANEWWSVEVLDALLNEVVSGYKVDEDRIAVTGLSMGGYGTWNLAIAFPDRFAAIAPICGGGNPLEACKLVDWMLKQKRTQ